MGDYARGDAAAFDEVYAFVSPRLYAFCLRMAGRKPEADDVFQDTFLKLHRSRASYVPGTNVLHWSFAIARSTFLDRMRHKKRRPEDLVDGDDAAARLDAAAMIAESPESAAHALELMTIVHRELARMSDRNRTAYILLRQEGLTVDEAAAVMGTSNDAIKQRAHRANETIREAVTVAGWQGAWR
jgi:RNA polymerase sigma-70 factor (ECF subfamily)